jgi:hypothetical protein
MWKLPNLSMVYRQRAGKPNSLGCLEKDFCAAAKEWRPHRITMVIVDFEEWLTSVLAE